MVDIYVGPDRVHFRIHQKLLCQDAPVFDRMFNGSFEEAAKKSADLPADEPETFDSFLQWLYRATLDKIDKTTVNSKGGSMWNRIKLYCFADKYCIDVLADSTMDTIIDGFTGVSIRADSICLAYNNTSQGAALRSYMSTGFAYELLMKFGKNTEEDLRRLANISDFSLDVFTVMINPETKTPTNPDHLSKCIHHRHGKDKPCTNAERC
jgi:hypothetical protein